MIGKKIKVSTSSLFASSGSASNASVLFDGVDEYISVPDSNSLDIASNWSLSFWVKIVDTSVTQYIVAKFKTASDQRSFYVRAEPGGKVKVRWFTQGTSTPYREAFGTTALSQDVWYHVVITYASDDSAKIYINGVDDNASLFSSGTTDGTIYQSSSDIVFARLEGTTAYGELYLTNVSLFDTTVLSQSDVTKIYNGGKIIDVDKLSLSASLVSYWKFSSDTNLIKSSGVIDAFGSNHGSAINMETSDLTTDVP